MIKSAIQFCHNDRHNNNKTYPGEKYIICNYKFLFVIISNFFLDKRSFFVKNQKLLSEILFQKLSSLKNIKRGIFYYEHPNFTRI